MKIVAAAMYKNEKKGLASGLIYFVCNTRMIARMSNTISLLKIAMWHHWEIMQKLNIELKVQASVATVAEQRTNDGNKIRIFTPDFFTVWASSYAPVLQLKIF